MCIGHHIRWYGLVALAFSSPEKWILQEICKAPRLQCHHDSLPSCKNSTAPCVTENAGQGTVSSLQEPLKISVALNLIEQAVVSFNAIQTGVKMVQIMPKGMCMPIYIVAMVQYHPFRMGWCYIFWRVYQFLKPEPHDAGDFCLALSIKVNHDRT